MWQLYQFALCPFSRKVRLLMGEKGVGYQLVREYPWERRDEFVDLNPTSQTPVLVESERGLTLIHSNAICEYLEETVDQSPMISGTAPNRAEIRRLTAWFDEQFYMQVVGPLLHERMKKRLILRQPPDRIIGKGRDDRRVQAEATFQSARDVVFAAAFPHLKLTRGVNAPVARIEPQHDFAEGDQIPTAFFFRSDL